MNNNNKNHNSNISSRNLVFVHYDDTIFPTTALLKAGALADTTENVSKVALRRLPSATRRLLSTHEQLVLDMLTDVHADNAEIQIVSNNMLSWVITSCQVFMPRVWSFLQEHRIGFTYSFNGARNVYNPCGYFEHSTWKVWTLDSSTRSQAYTVCVESAVDGVACTYRLRSALRSVGNGKNARCRIVRMVKAKSSPTDMREVRFNTYRLNRSQ